MKILTLLTPVFGISLKNTPPINEVYEQVLRIKHDAKDGHEKLLLELSDLSKNWDEETVKNAEVMESMKSQLSKFQKAFSALDKAVSSTQMDTKALSKTMESIMVELQTKMAQAEASIDHQHSQAQELIQRVDNEIKSIKSEITTRVEESMSDSEKMSHRLDDIEIRQEEFIRMTQAKLAKLSKIEQHSQKILANIKEREEKNLRGMATIEDFESSTANQITAHETELRMLQRSMRAMQNRLNVDEFKEEKLQETMTQMTLEMLNKIATLDAEIVAVMSGQTPVEKEKHDEIKSIASELKSIENLVLYQQSEIEKMDSTNELQVVELKKTDSTLRTKLSNVENDIHKLGSGILFRNEFMKKFKF